MTSPLWWLFAAQAAPPSPETLLRQGKVAEALAAADAVAEAAPADVAAQELYIDLLLNLGMSGKARQEASTRVQAHPTDPDAHYLLGRAELAADPARRAYEAALRLDPTHARSHMGMGAIHESARDLPAARVSYERATREDATLGEAWLGSARTALLAGDLPGGTAVTDAGLAACPDEPGLVLLAAQLHPDRAEALLAAGLRVVPDEPRLREALAERLLDRGAAAAALTEVRAALALDPSSADGLRLELVAREVAEGRLGDAGRRQVAELTGDAGTRAAWDALVVSWPRSALIVLGRGGLRLRTGDPSGLDDLLAALVLDPTNVEAQAAAGLALLDRGQAARAEPLLAQAAAARPWDASLGIARWRALVATGQSRAAADFVAGLARLHPFDPAVLVAQAGSLVDTGDVQGAYRVVRGGLLLVPDPRLAAAFVQIAPAAGHPDEAAALLDQIVAQTGNTALAAAAAKLRGQ